MASLRLFLVLVLMTSTLLCSMRHAPVQAKDSDDWLGWAKVAWRYFQPDVGFNPTTGLLYANSGWHRFTDWDLGVYIHAILNAERLGLVSRNGDWGADSRFEKVLSFLETRRITPTRQPYRQYSADSGGVPDDIGQESVDPSDFGRLLLALDDLRHLRPDLASRIQSVVARYNSGLIAGSEYFARDDIYPFYAAQGFHAFGFSTPKLKNLELLGGGSFIEVYGEPILKAWVTSDPLMIAILENRTSPLYETYAERVFLAQEKRYNSTGILTAFGEGSYTAPHYYVFEWVATYNGETWRIRASDWVNGPAVVYSSIAFAFRAIFPNDYTAMLMSHVSELESDRGFFEGIFDNDESALAVLSSKTNGMVLEAAGYALQGSIPEFATPVALMIVAVTLTVLAVTKLNRKQEVPDQRYVGHYPYRSIIMRWQREPGVSCQMDEQASSSSK